MPTENESISIDIQALWCKYEDIAMHFNDLLMRLRVQSIGGVAAISTLVGIFAKSSDSDLSNDWLAVTGLFSAITFSWIAIFCLDFFYYNRLLNGAVSALKELEQATLEGSTPKGIKLSTVIEEEFTLKKPAKAAWGVRFFYGIVFIFLIAASLFSLTMYRIETKRAVAASPASGTFHFCVAAAGSKACD